MFKQIIQRLSPLFAFRLLVNTVKEFFLENSFFHGAALAYYAIFAMVPILYLAINYVGMLLGNELMIEIITTAIRNNIGITDVNGILVFLEGIDFEKSNFFYNLVGIVVLLISSTALLNSLRSSINQFYSIKADFPNRKKMFFRTVISKLVSVVLMAGIGLVVIVFYFAQTIALSISDGWLSDYTIINWLFSSVVRHSIAILSNVIIFSFMFKYLHDGIVGWKVAIRGALFTSILLYIGQIFIKYYISNYFFGSSAGVAGSILVILVWMYYTSQIIFLGAKFTKVYADMIHQPIKNRKY